MKRIVIIGASGHGKVVADIAIRNGYDEIVFLDDNKELISSAGIPVAGRCSDIVKYKDWDVFVAIGDAATRKRIMDNLTDYQIVTLIHPRAVVSRRVVIGKGTVVMAGAVINSDTKVGKGCIVNTGATVDHDGSLKDFVHVSVGAHLAGNVTVEGETWIGAGAIILNNIQICAKCMIGAGAVIIRNIKTCGTYVGIPAKRIK